MPAFAYTGMQYARKASYYFARSEKNGVYCAAPVRVEILLQRKKASKNRLIQGGSKVRGRAGHAKLARLSNRLSGTRVFDPLTKSSIGIPNTKWGAAWT
jgi:hypothetical protein